MKYKKDMITKNSKCQWHGYQELYYIDDTILHRCNYKNEKQIGYYEYHDDSYDDSQSNTSFYII